MMRKRAVLYQPPEVVTRDQDSPGGAAL